MKKISKFYFALLITPVIFISSCTSGRSLGQGDPGVSINYQTFYDDLSPYGTWIDYLSYGQVWHPNVAGNFRPYLTNGAWDYSDAGWMWTSNYNWGWAPFHYGRWAYDDMYGWLWIPGYDWSPAWVTWGSFGDNYCWAPLMPGINVGIGYGHYRPHSFYWNAVPRRHIYDRDIDRREVPREQINNSVTNITVINNFSTTKIHNQYYSKGPDVKDVERYTSQTIKPSSIGERNTAGPARREGNQLQVYRPSVNNPQPKEFRRTDNEHVKPIISNQGNPDQSVKGNEKQRINNNENQVNAPERSKESKVTEPARNNENQMNAPIKNNENPVIAPARNKESQATVPTRNNENQMNAPVRNNENREAAPVRNDENRVTPPARNNENRETAPARINQNQSRPMNRVDEPIRNNEMEQRQNLERLPIYHAPNASSGNRTGSSGIRRR